MIEIEKWSEVLDIISGKNQKEVESADGRYPIYGSGGIIGYANDYRCPENTVIIGRKGTIDTPIFVKEKIWNIDTAFGLKPKENLNPRFLFYFCEIFNFKALDKSTGRPSLAKGDLLKIEMPVPSIAEQERIVSRIEELFSELDNAVETLNATKKQLEVYRQAVLKDAFRNCQSWERHTFADLMETVRNGYSKKPSDKGNYKILKISAVRALHLDFEEHRYNEFQLSDDDSISENDILFTRYNGSRELVGVCTVVPKLHEKIGYPDKIIKCTPILRSAIHSKYLSFYMSQGDAKKYLRSKIKTTSGQNGIAGSDIKNTIVYVPDLAVQKKIVEGIESRLSVCESIEKTVDSALSQASAMRQSILKQAFEGGLQ